MTNVHDHTNEKWENGELGASDKHARKVSEKEENAVDDALDLQVVSIRLQKGLIESFKELAKVEGIGYQPLMRQVLMRHIQNTLNPHKRLKLAK